MVFDGIRFGWIFFIIKKSLAQCEGHTLLPHFPQKGLYEFFQKEWSYDYVFKDDSEVCSPVDSRESLSLQ